MNMTERSGNPKIPTTLGDLRLQHSQPDMVQIAMSNNRPIDPSIINRIREIDTKTVSMALPSRPLPFQRGSGLLYRDFIGVVASGNRECGGCGGKK
jgi:hypothetical protein